MPKPKKPDEVIRILKEHDSRFQVFVNRGKGSHRMIYHPDVNGKAAACPMPYHKGQDLRKGMLKQIIRRFNLPGNIFG